MFTSLSPPSFPVLPAVSRGSDLVALDAGIFSCRPVPRSRDLAEGAALPADETAWSGAGLALLSRLLGVAAAAARFSEPVN